MKENVTPITFKSYTHSSDYYVMVADSGNQTLYDSFVPIYQAIYANDTGKALKLLNFTTKEELNSWMYTHLETKKDPQFINSGIGFNGYVTIPGPTNIGYKMAVYYNETDTNSFLYGSVMALRMLWKKTFGVNSEFKIATTRLYQQIQQIAFGNLGPILISTGLISFIPLLISQPIIDINGEIRPFMVSCTLTLFPYWFATFLIDFALWFIVVTLIWAVFVAAKIAAFMDNLFNTWYGLVIGGPSFILSTYCMSFLFSTPASASRQLFLIFTIILLVPMIVDIVRNYQDVPVWVDGIYSVIPHTMILRLLFYFMSNIGQQKQPLSYYFKNENSQVLLIMQFGNIFIYGFILFIIEKVRLSIQSSRAKKDFGGFDDFFKSVKDKHPVTPEVQEMESQVHNPNEKWAVRIENVSRLFFNTANQPIPAVNNVSLGIREGSLFGFLGANGAGKTTLIKMITGLLPVSNGKIEVNGIDITQDFDSTLISICPQFNTHLLDELTPAEHFTFFSLLFRLSEEETQRTTEKLMSILELSPIKDIPIRELSGGDVRKLAIAMSFLGPSKIILLDEPTASLDPVARYRVHEMITSFRNQKTFMLCTHLLSEAETLCDNISIMIKGCVYTVGTPQYLSEKFGTEYRIDIALKDDSIESGDKCDDFLERKLPTSIIEICRPKARIYSIPATDVTLPNLFDIMQEGKVGDNGFNYYTCSSSSLERVFMEIVRISETEDYAFTASTPAESKPQKKEENEDFVIP